MSQQKQQQPKIEWGFYAVVPRIVRTQYKNLSHAEKWLYTCLKDLCGDKGTCFRTLRALSEETDISIASLSTMIPHLQKEGLIHAEKKRRKESGKEVWHISIVDVWQANATYCMDHCSKNEQVDCSNSEQTPQVVQILNKDVQILNNEQVDCSNSERDCSNFPYRRITMKNNITEEDTSISDTVQTPEPATPSGVEAHAPLSNDQQEQTPLIASDGLQEKVVSKSGARKPRAPVDETLKVRIEDVYAFFDKLAQETSGDATYRYQRTKKATDAITQWLKGPTSHELLREVYLQMWAEPANPRTGFQWKNNMKIHSVLAEYDSRSLAIKAKRHAAQPKPATLFTQAAKHVDDDEPLQYRPFPSQIQKARQQSLAAARRA